MKLKPLGANRTEITLADGTTVLFSYQTPVACHIPGRGYFKTEKQWSRTTSKHIGQWLDATIGDKVTHRPQEFFDGLTGSSSAPYQPKTGARCACKPGVQRDNCPECEGTGMRIDFAAIRRAT